MTVRLSRRRPCRCLTHSTLTDGRANAWAFGEGASAQFYFGKTVWCQPAAQDREFLVPAPDRTDVAKTSVQTQNHLISPIILVSSSAISESTG
jgi:hypothetical protein